MPSLEKLQEQGSRSIWSRMNPCFHRFCGLRWPRVSIQTNTGSETSIPASTVSAWLEYGISPTWKDSVLGLYKWLVTHPAEAGEVREGLWCPPGWRRTPIATLPKCPSSSKSNCPTASNDKTRQNNWPTGKSHFGHSTRSCDSPRFAMPHFLWLAEKVRRPEKKKRARYAVAPSLDGP